MNKPKYLYHGSRYKLDKLKPQQAYGSPTENGDEYGIYAYENKNMVIPFSFTITPFENGSMAIYIDDKTSEKIDDKQWLSKDEVIPVEINIIHTKDYMHKITFTGAAKEYRSRTQ